MLLTIFGGITRALKRYMTYRRTVNELQLLSTRDLADLGINRCDIEFIARNASNGIGR